MRQLYKAIDKAILKAVASLYLRNAKITLADSRINGQKVHWHVFTAIVERIKYNANLHGKLCRPGRKSQIILNIRGKQKIFKVSVFGKDLILSKYAE